MTDPQGMDGDSPEPDSESGRRTVRQAHGTAVAQTLLSPSTDGAKSGSGPQPVDPASPALLDPLLEEVRHATGRYAGGRVLGEGAMGVVHLRSDGRIGRDVAMKVISPEAASSLDARARFLREARVQGQLEHPSVVPVYDLGVSEGGQVFFTMKRVRGHTLQEIIDGARAGDAHIIASYSRRKLLGALSTLSLAVAFAHSRGVVHRDIKPANVMLGDFGEVNILDWGVAKLKTVPESTQARRLLGADDGQIGQTQTGTVVGTPGYMAPEQARGDIDAVDSRSDIYALGALLYEVLTLEPLHSGQTAQMLLVDTITGQVSKTPSSRAPDAQIPPELDAVCERALALDPAERFQSAREFEAAIASFLDGERDLERRKEQAEEHLLRAQNELSRAAAGGADRESHRIRGLRELGQALALDPEHGSAMETLGSFLLDPASDLPPEAEKELAEVNQRDRTEAANANSVALASWVLMLPLVLLLGIRSWPLLGIVTGLIAVQVAISLWMGRTGNTQPRFMRYAMPFMFVSIALLFVFFGPLVVVPGVVVANASAFMVSIRANRQTRNFILAMSLASVLIPVLLQFFGVLPPSYLVEDGVIKILPLAVEFPEQTARIFLVACAIMTLVLGNLLVGRAVEALTVAERRIFVQAWRLRQLLPEAPQSRR